MADVKWIKMATDIFDNRKIRQIESLPDGDAIIVIWMKLLCLAGNINDSGLVYFTREIPYTDQMLSTQFNRPITTIQLALKTFEQFGMVEVIDNLLHISNWEKYQSVDRLLEIREYNRLAKQKSREKKKMLQNVNDMSMTCQPCHDTEEEKDKEIERDKKKKKEVDYDFIVQKFNTMCESLPKVTILSEKRKKAMDMVFIKESVISLEYLDELFLKVESSDFLTGRTGNWKANFDWLMNPTNIAKVIDGNYDHKNKPVPTKNKFNDFPQRQYDMNSMEKLLLNKNQAKADDP